MPNPQNKFRVCWIINIKYSQFHTQENDTRCSFNPWEKLLQEHQSIFHLQNWVEANLINDNALCIMVVYCKDQSTSENAVISGTIPSSFKHFPRQIFHTVSVIFARKENSFLQEKIVAMTTKCIRSS